MTGRSMENIMRVATELGYMKLPKNTVMDVNKIKSMPLDKQVLMTTGTGVLPLDGKSYRQTVKYT